MKSNIYLLCEREKTIVTKTGPLVCDSESNNLLGQHGAVTDDN
jgi:hypothetical protein